MDLPSLDAIAIASDIRARRRTAMEVATTTLARIRAVNPRINAFTAIFDERALTEARRVDALIADGKDPGPLAGVPFAVKNLFDVTGVTTLAGSIIRRSYKPAVEDATIIRRLCAAGAVLVGTTNMDEFAFGFTTENAHYGATRNPHDLERIAGGSSGGSAAAVAAGLVPFALGTDTGGSIRVPAALTGLYGLRATFGRLPRTGTVLFVPSIDHVGPLARSARDLSLVYDVMQGHDAADTSSSSLPPEPTQATLTVGIAGLRIAVAGGYFQRYAASEAREAVDRVALHLGATRDIAVPAPEIARAAAFLIGQAEGASLHHDNIRERFDRFDPGTSTRFLAAALLPAAWYAKAQRVRRWLNDELDRMFEQVDVVLAATTPFTAPKLGQQTIDLNGETLIARPTVGLLTQPFSATGAAIVSVPLKASNGMPIGVQVIAAPYREEIALRVAASLERDGIAAAQIAA